MSNEHTPGTFEGTLAGHFDCRINSKQIHFHYNSAWKDSWKIVFTDVDGKVYTGLSQMPPLKDQTITFEKFHDVITKASRGLTRYSDHCHLEIYDDILPKNWSVELTIALTTEETKLDTILQSWVIVA